MIYPFNFNTYGVTHRFICTLRNLNIRVRDSDYFWDLMEYWTKYKGTYE